MGPGAHHGTVRGLRANGPQWRIARRTKSRSTSPDHAVCGGLAIALLRNGFGLRRMSVQMAEVDIAADVCRCPVADRPVAGTAPRACAMHRFLSPRWSAGRETERNLRGTHQAVDVLLRRQFQFQLDQDRTQTDSIKEQAAVTASPDHRRRYSARG